jgi:sugar lactone lactonase YvrE
VARCTACHAFWAWSQTGASNTNEVELAAKNFKSVGQLTSGINNVALGLTQDLKGNLYVGQSSTNQILVFPAGSEVPTRTLTLPTTFSVYYLAANKAGDLFVDGSDTSGVFHLYESNDGGKTFGALKITAAFPGGLAVDKKQNLWVADQGNGTSGTISEYAPPYVKLKTSFSYAGDDTEISIDSTNTELVAANNTMQGTSVYSGGVVYSIPSGKVLSSASQSLGNMYGICFQKPSKI